MIYSKCKYLLRLLLLVIKNIYNLPFISPNASFLSYVSSRLISLTSLSADGDPVFRQCLYRPGQTLLISDTAHFGSRQRHTAGLAHPN